MSTDYEKNPGEAPFSLGKGHVIAASPKSLLVQLDNSRGFYDPLTKPGVWLPYSVIHDDSEVFEKEGDNSSGEVVVKFWKAEAEKWV